MPLHNESTLKRWRLLLQQGWRQVVPHEAVDGPLVKHFRARQIQALLAFLPLIALGNVCNTVIICGYFWNELPRPWLLAWCVSATTSLAIAHVWWGRLIVVGKRATAEAWTAPLISVQVIFFAALWCAMPVLVFPVADHNGAMLIATVIVGMICGGAFMLSPQPQAALAYVITMGGACIVGLMSSSYASSEGLLVLLTVYCVIMSGVVLTSAQAFMSRLRAEAETDRQKQLVDLLLRDFEEHASDWLWEISPTGHLRHVSARLAESFGMPARQLSQRSFIDLLKARWRDAAYWTAAAGV